LRRCLATSLAVFPSACNYDLTCFSPSACFLFHLKVVVLFPPSPPPVPPHSSDYQPIRCAVQPLFGGAFGRTRTAPPPRRRWWRSTDSSSR
jgi:hypothetical protein